jgi:hypothetical protein
MSQKRLGVTGVISGFIGIAIAIYRHHIYQPTKQGIIPTLFDGTQRQSDIPTILYLIFGFLAIGFGVIAFLNQESRRTSGMAAALGVVAIGWSYVLLAVFVAVLILVFGVLSDGWSI